MFGRCEEPPCPHKPRKVQPQDTAGNPLPRNPRPRELSAMSNPNDHSLRFQTLELGRVDFEDMMDHGSRARAHYGSADGGNRKNHVE